MRLIFNKNLRIASIFITAIIISINSFLLYKETSNLDFKEEKVSVYNYNNKKNINYRIFLKPNILYADESVGEGSIYLSEFVDNIKATFEYKFEGERVADIKGSYQVIAIAEGYITEKEKTKTIWTKQFMILPKESFNVKDKTMSITKDIPIKFLEYNDFAQKIIKDSKVNSQVKLLVSMNINLKAETDKGVIEEKMSPSIIIPLNTGFFEIVKNQVEEKPGTIQELRRIKLPINKKVVAIYSISLSTILIILLYLIFFTSGVVEDDPFEKKLKKIFKNHGSRLVALNSELAVTHDSYHRVKSIEDLVRIADEIGKPIMYKYSSDYKDISHFYVYDDSQVYLLDLQSKSSKSDNQSQQPKDISNSEDLM